MAVVLTEHTPAVSWAMLFVDELVRCGLRHVCIAPGSRSTPLALAFFANEDKVHIHPHLDERSAAFYALGLAAAADYPVALLCTSGTAGANFYPAVIEAYMSQIPLIVLTADRPPELRHSGANQTIDQVKMFSDHVVWSVHMDVPGDNMPPVALRNVRTSAARSLAIANGIRKGPVHLNFPFRKPLQPDTSQLAKWQERPAHGQEGWATRPFTAFERGELRPTEDQISRIAELIEIHARGLIICGPRCAAGGFPAAVGRLARMSGYPILADPLSGVRFGPHVMDAPVSGLYETYLRTFDAQQKPDLILRFGALPTSKRLNNFLDTCGASVQIHIRENGVWADEHHRTTFFLQADPELCCDLLSAQLTPAQDLTWLEAWIEKENLMKRQFAEHLPVLDFDGAYVAKLMGLLADKSVLFAGNSLPIRHVDQFACPSTQSLFVYANRGASGIDGNISTGLGIAQHRDLPTTILVGDVTFLHDSNGLLAIKKQVNREVTIVVLNNNGGGIFSRLPIAQVEPPFSALFRMPHDLDLASFATLHGLDYVRITSQDGLRSSMSAQTGMARLIEIRTDAAQDEQIRQTLEDQLLSRN